MAGTAKVAGAPAAVRRGAEPVFAALDLGTNNCRLLLATPQASGFRVLDAYSRIVRLGEGLSRTGRLDPGAMQRTHEALAICAERIARRGADRVRAVATQACRQAADGARFVAEVQARTGLKLEVIAPEEEARLSVIGCLDLVDPGAAAALVVDVGGGSTELSWLDLGPERGGGARVPERPPVQAWCSIPLGVVTLAERFPEPIPASREWFEAMVAFVRPQVAAFAGAQALRPVFQRGGGQLIGASGAITSLAGVHLGLKRYERARVDGLWLSPQSCTAAVERLMALGPAERALQPCIGPDRADLVLAGAAILQAVQDVWPCPRVRVADRGLREGILLSLMQQHRRSDGAGAPRAAAALA